MRVVKNRYYFGIMIMMLSLCIIGCICRQTQGELFNNTKSTASEPTVSELETQEESQEESTVSELEVQEESHGKLSDQFSAQVWDYSTPQVGDAIVPQPGDTTETWNLARAGEYPDDADCSATELLEKWMAVEGIDYEDLMERGCRQLVLIVAGSEDGCSTTTNCYEYTGSNWATIDGLYDMHGWTGLNGIRHQRYIGSYTSPAGLWKLGLCFGNETKPEGLKMQWRDVTPYSDWVCDVDSLYFNTWQERNDPDLTEKWDMSQGEHLDDYPFHYAYSCVIEYNTPPYTVTERGCAIFFHCASGTTGGCIGLPTDDMLRVMLWMDPVANPYILITGWQAEE
ncbi:MAG: hypothetical protein IJK56_01280 [Firmicutes bacterium]|nr:hypothetical protein [Bacillota bacterium]